MVRYLAEEAGIVPVADAMAVARRCAAGKVVETVRRSGKFGAQPKRLEATGFSRFVIVRAAGGMTVRGDRGHSAVSRSQRAGR